MKHVSLKRVLLLTLLATFICNVSWAGIWTKYVKLTANTEDATHGLVYVRSSNVTANINYKATSASTAWGDSYGAAICGVSDSEGKISFANTPENGTTHQILRADNNTEAIDIDVTAPQLLNGDGSYTLTDTISAGTIMSYCDTIWMEQSTSLAKPRKAEASTYTTTVNGYKYVYEIDSDDNAHISAVSSTEDDETLAANGATIDFTFPTEIGGYKVVEVKGTDGGSATNSTSVFGGLMMYIRSVTVPEGVTALGNYAFYGIRNVENNIETITLPNGLETIGNYALNLGRTGIENPKVKELSIPSSVKSLGQYCIGIGSLTKIDFGTDSKLEELSKYSFSGCPNLTVLKLPAGVKTLGGAIISNCTNLLDIILEGGSITSSDLNSKSFPSSSYKGRVYFPIQYANQYKAATLKSKNATLLAYRTNVHSDYSTVCLPFTVSADNSKGIDGFYSEKQDGFNTTSITFSSTDELEAGKPYVFKKASGEVSNIDIDGFVAFARAGTYSTVELTSNSSTYFKGTFSDITVNDDGKSYYVLQDDSTFVKVASGGIIPAYSSYIETTWKDNSLTLTLNADGTLSVKRTPKFHVDVTGYEAADDGSATDTPIAVNADVYGDYSFKVSFPDTEHDNLSASKATVNVQMNGVQSLGLKDGETRSYSKTINTGINFAAKLSGYLTETYGFDGLTCPVTIKEADGSESHSFDYNIAAINAEYQIIGTPTSEDDARTAWHFLTSKVEASQDGSADDTHMLFKKGSYIQMGKQRLTFTNDFDFLKGNALGEGVTMSKLFEDAKVTTTDDNENVGLELFLPAGSTLGMSSSAATLTENMKLTETGADLASNTTI